MSKSALAEFAPLTPPGDYAPPQPVTTPMADVPGGMQMDREFILRHQVVERYLAGKLPLKGKHDFERFCRDNPEALESIGLADALQAGLRLMDASGQPLPWDEKPRQFWEKLPFIASATVLAVVLAVTSMVLAGKLSNRTRSLATMTTRMLEQPLDPATSTRSVLVKPSRTAPSLRSVVTLGGAGAQLADLKFDLSWSRYNSFKVTIDRVDQGRVAVLGHMQRDSNGHVRIAFNTTALGPGSYQLVFEGINLRGDTTPEAWVTIGVAPHPPG